MKGQNRDKVQSMMYEVRTKYERIKHHVYSMRLTGDRYTPGWKLDALPSVRNIKREKRTEIVH
jgi:hypothetical protein